MQKNRTPSPKQFSVQGQQGKASKPKIKKKPLDIVLISTQRTQKTNDYLSSQRSPGTRTTKTTKQTLETKRSVSPEELKKHKSKGLITPPRPGKSKSRNSSPIQLYIKEKKKSTQLKVKELKCKKKELEDKKKNNLLKLQKETQKIFQKPKKQKKQCKKQQKLPKKKLDEILQKFQDISKRFERVQMQQIQKFEQEIEKHKQSQAQTHQNDDESEELNAMYQQALDACLIIQRRWRQYKQKKQKQVINSKQESIDWEAQGILSHFTSPSQEDEGFLFCQPGEKQVHISNIRSSIVSEESQSIMNQLNQEFENWNLYLQRIVKDQDISGINKQMQQQIVQIVQNHLRKIENHSERRSEKEIQQEKSFNAFRKRKSDELSKSNVLQLQQQSMKEENKLLSFREETIFLRYDAEQKHITDGDKQLLDDWLNRELEDLQNTRTALELSHRREISTLKKIQRDILIASAELEQDPQENQQIQQIQKKIDEQFVVDQDIQQRNEEDIQKTLDLVSGEILNDIIDEFSEEILINKDNLDLIISQLIINQDQFSVPTSINDIEQYLNNLFQYVIQNHKIEFINNLNTPFGFTPERKLKLIHGYDDDEEDNMEGIDDQLAFPLPERLFLEYEHHRLMGLQNDDQVSYAIRELEHIHNKAIFDAFNEALNQYRPYFQTSGIQYPWESQKYSLETINDKNLDQRINEAKKQVIEWGKTLCGFLPLDEEDKIKEEKQQIVQEKNLQMLMQQLNLVENPLQVDLNLQFDNLAIIRDEQLYKLLIGDIKEQEYKWFLIEDDRTEFLLELGDLIFENLVEEFSKEI